MSAQPQKTLSTNELFFGDIFDMFECMTKDFKSPVSTIPPRGQVIDLHDHSPEYMRNGGAPQPPKATRQPGTDAQRSAQPYHVMPESMLSPEYQERFWSYVSKGPGCWEWQKSSCRAGYGRVRAPGTRAQFRAHRVAYFLQYRKDPLDMLVMHKCDNPRCCRPDHLTLGTHQDNMDDMAAKGRWRPGSQGGSANGNSRLSEADIWPIVQMFRAGLTNRQIASQFTISHSLVSRIRTGRSWRKETARLGYEPKPSRQAPKSGRTAFRGRSPTPVYSNEGEG